MPSYDKFNQTLIEHNISEETICKINAGFDGLAGDARRDAKREYFRHAMDVLESELPRDELISPMDDNGCCKMQGQYGAGKGLACICKGEQR